MARAIWSGVLSVGLVNVPVRLYPATEKRDIRFHEFDEKTGKRVRHKRVVQGSDREVDYADVEKGYEVSSGKYVLLTKEELAAADPEKSRTLEIEGFVDLSEIDPVYFEKTYYLGPESADGAKRAYALLVKALEDTGMAGIARFVMRSKEYLATIRARDGGLILETMYFPDEIRDFHKTVAGVPIRVKVQPRDVQMASRLIEGLAMEWNPSSFKDTHRQHVLALIRRKGKGQEIVADEPEARAAPTDLMDALKASVEAVRKKQSKPKRSRSRARKAG